GGVRAGGAPGGRGHRRPARRAAPTAAAAADAAAAAAPGGPARRIAVRRLGRGSRLLGPARGVRLPSPPPPAGAPSPTLQQLAAVPGRPQRRQREAVESPPAGVAPGEDEEPGHEDHRRRSAEPTSEL